jgi:hypothetical protein
MDAFNCIAYAGGICDGFVWPSDDWANSVWVSGVPRSHDIAALACLYSALGFTPCVSGDSEAGLEKVALFASGRYFTHASRQLQSGLWSSNLAREELISYPSPLNLEGSAIGAVCMVMQPAARPVVSWASLSTP